MDNQNLEKNFISAVIYLNTAENAQRKPNKEAFIQAIGEYKPEECIMIGDDPYLDIQRAKEEGLSTILVNSKGIETNSSMGIVVNSVEEISQGLISKMEPKDFER